MKELDSKHNEFVEEARARIIGPRSDFYLRSWGKAGRTGASWNWSAFFISVLFPAAWFAYRKVWGWASLAVLLTLGLPMLEYSGGVSTHLSILVAAVFALLIGLYANLIYEKHVDAIADKIRSADGPGSERLTWWNNGGVSWMAASAAIILSLSVIPLTTALYNKLSASMVTVAPTTGRVGDHLSAKMKWTGSSVDRIWNKSLFEGCSFDAYKAAYDGLLPPGITFDPKTKTFNGVPAAPGYWQGTLSFVVACEKDPNSVLMKKRIPVEFVVSK